MSNITSNERISYRALQISESSEFFDAAARSVNGIALALIINKLKVLARHDDNLRAAMREIAIEAEQAEEAAMIDYYTGRDTSADLDSIHYGQAA